MTCGPIRRFVVTAAAAAAVSLLLIYLDAAAQTRPASNGSAGLGCPLRAHPTGSRISSGRWGRWRRRCRRRRWSAGDRAERTSPSVRALFEYTAALAAGRVSANAKIVGRQPNYRHGNNLYWSVMPDSRNGRSATRRGISPEVWERVQYLDENGNKEDTTFPCFPPGVPRLGPPMRILQTPKDVVLLYQNRNTWRVIPTDGRPHDPVNSQDQTFVAIPLGAGGRYARHRGDRLQRRQLARLARMVPHEQHEGRRAAAPRGQHAALPGDGPRSGRADGAVGDGSLGNAAQHERCALPGRPALPGLRPVAHADEGTGLNLAMTLTDLRIGGFTN